MTDAVRPKSPSAADKSGGMLRPEEYNPEMAQAVTVKEMISRLPKPAIISKEFLCFQGIWESLNDVPDQLDENGNVITKGHKTGFDASLRCLLYRSVGNESVNRDGALFNAFWSWANKPKIIMQGMPVTPTFAEEKPTLGRRIINALTGGGNKQEANNQ